MDFLDSILSEMKAQAPPKDPKIVAKEKGFLYTFYTVYPLHQYAYLFKWFIIYIYITI